MAAYHLAFNDKGTLFVTGPTTSSNQSVYAIDRDGRTTVFYQGLGRAQGMAFDVSGNLYVAASLRGQRGIVRITPGGRRRWRSRGTISSAWRFWRMAAPHWQPKTPCTMWLWILREGDWCEGSKDRCGLTSGRADRKTRASERYDC